MSMTCRGQIGLVLGILLLGGCGGMGSSTSVETIELLSEPILDGAVRSNGSIRTGVDETGIFTGDDDNEEPGVGSRQFFSFALAPIPDGALSIEAATLQIKQEDSDGDPFANHGVVIVDHLVYGNTLDAADYAAPSLTSALGPFSSDRTSGVRSLDVTSQVVADVRAGRPRSQFRVRFSLVDSDNNGKVERLHFRDADNSSQTTPPPVLVVVYRVPSSIVF